MFTAIYDDYGSPSSKKSRRETGCGGLQVKDPDVQETLELLSERQHWPKGKAVC